MKKTFLILLSVLFILGCAGKKNIREGKFDPKVWLSKADALLKDEEFDEARRLLFEVKNRDLTKKYAPIAQLKLGESYEAEEKPDEAINEYRRFKRLYPDHPQASYAQYKIAMVYFKQIDSPKKGAGGGEEGPPGVSETSQGLPTQPIQRGGETPDKKVQEPYRRVRDACREILLQEGFLQGSSREVQGSDKELSRDKGIS